MPQNLFCRKGHSIWSMVTVSVHSLWPHTRLRRKHFQQMWKNTFSVFSLFPIVIAGENWELQMPFARLTSYFPGWNVPPRIGSSCGPSRGLSSVFITDCSCGINTLVWNLSFVRTVEIVLDWHSVVLLHLRRNTKLGQSTSTTVLKI